MKGEIATTQTTAQLLNIQRFCLHDGPGIRTVVFFKGCPLRCLWCSNPESQSGACELMYHRRLCIGCRECEGACTSGALHGTQEGLVIDRQVCSSCGTCVQRCPSGALEMPGKSTTVEEILEEVKRDRAYYENSGGGVTLSGGEPLAQSEVALALLNVCRREGFHTTVETCGHVSPEVLTAVGPLVDLFLFDIKAVNQQHHLEGTGHGNRLILANLRKLCDSGASVTVRVPLIPGYNLNDTFKNQLVDLLGPLPIGGVELMPYHRLGSSKLRALGRGEEPEPFSLPAIDELERFRAALVQYLRVPVLIR